METPSDCCGRGKGLQVGGLKNEANQGGGDRVGSEGNINKVTKRAAIVRRSASVQSMGEGVGSAMDG